MSLHFFIFMIKIYKSAPLPFQGQKRGFLSKYKQVIECLPDDVIIVDLFGGSGLLSRAAKDIKSKATVVYNDYDGYVDRIADIERTNIIIADIRNVLKGYVKGERLNDKHKSVVMSLMDSYNVVKSIDYKTIASNLLFSGKFIKNYEDFKKQTFYNNLSFGMYNADNYLDGLIIEHDDYEAIYNKYKKLKNVVYIFDPPYLFTDVDSYKMMWTLGDYIKLIKLLYNNKYIYFSSNKSMLLELFTALTEFGLKNPFENSEIIYRNITINKGAGYKDIMIYKL